MQAVVSRLQSANVIVLLSHVRPDGDALGSMAAVARSGKGARKKCTIISPAKLPWRYEFLLAGLTTAEEGAFADLAEACDCVVVLDTSSLAQLEGLGQELTRLADKTVVIDHHKGPDDLAAIQWIDQSAAATAIMVMELIDHLGWPVGPDAAEALAAAILTDTGWLKYSNTDPRALEAVSKLVAAGVRPDELYKRLYQSDRLQRVKLKARLLDSLAISCEGRLAVMTVSVQDFAESGAGQDETEGLVNEAMNIASVELVVLLVEGAGPVRASLRSRGGVDVCEIARGFGGGGHAKAAGCHSQASLEQFRADVLRACSDALK